MTRALWSLLLGGCIAVAAVAEEPAAKAPTDHYDLIFLAESRPLLIRLHVRINDRACIQAWDEYLKALFQRFDADGDGVLTLAEAERIPAPQDLLTAGLFGGQNKVNLRRVDTKPRDEKITPEEFLAFYRQNVPPFQVTFAQGPGNTAQTLNDVLFKLLDVDKDGKISREELANAERLMKHDLDEDEILTAEELNPTRAAVTLFAQQEEMQPERPMRGGQTRPFVLVLPDDKTRAWRQELQNKYGKADGRLKGKLLRREDIGLDEAAFARMDKDGDGVLDSEELERFIDRPADVELIVRLGQRGQAAQLERVEGSPSAALNAQLRQGKQGQLGLNLGDTLLEFRCRDDGPAQAKINAQVAKQLAMVQFKNLDRDNNGYLEKSELENVPEQQGLEGIAAAFERMDADGDGKLFEKEFMAYVEKALADQAKAVASRATLTIADQGRGLFDLIDTNQDGRLTLRELKQAANRLAAIDVDGDGQLTAGEIPRTYQLTVHRDPASGRLPRAVVVTRMVSANPQRPDAGRGPLWFRKMDHNGDGDVSPAEFLGTPERFRQLDLDGDGLISAEEAEKAEEALRKQP